MSTFPTSPLSTRAPSLRTAIVSRRRSMNWSPRQSVAMTFAPGPPAGVVVVTMRFSKTFVGTSMPCEGRPARRSSSRESSRSRPASTFRPGICEAMARTSENSRHDLEPLIAAVDGLAGLAAFKLPEKLRVPDVAFELLDIGLAAIEHALFVVRDVAAFRRGLVHDGADGVGLGRPRFFKRRKSCHFGLPFEVERGDLPAPRRARL